MEGCLWLYTNENTYLGNIATDIKNSAAHSEAIQIFKIELFAKISNGWKPFAAFARRSILDVWVSSENVSETGHSLL